MSGSRDSLRDHGHDECDQTPLAADISLWKFFRATGVPPVGASDPDVDRAFDRIIRGAQNGLRLADVLQEIAAYADDFPGSEPLQRVRDMAMGALGDDHARDTEKALQEELSKIVRAEEGEGAEIASGKETRANSADSLSAASGGSVGADDVAAWVRDHFGPSARVSGDCVCGRQMTRGEYAYDGGSHGRYVCSDCGRLWIVDLNGAMWTAKP